jgi:hypothetical protein
LYDEWNLPPASKDLGLGIWNFDINGFLLFLILSREGTLKAPFQIVPFQSKDFLSGSMSGGWARLGMALAIDSISF